MKTQFFSTISRTLEKKMFLHFRTGTLLIMLQCWGLQTSILFAQNLQCNFNESISNSLPLNQFSSGGAAGSNVVCNDFM